VIRRVSELDPLAYLGAPRAAGMLGELGEPAGYAGVLRGMACRLGAMRIWTIKNAMPFIPLHGESYAPGETIDIWALYDRALQDDEFNVRYVAREQLALLDDPEAADLLAKYPEP
jgi:hypothetical protein